MESETTHANFSNSAIDRLSAGKQPAVPAIGRQIWSSLLFVHWRLPADAVAPLLPPQITLDTWQGDAWVGLVLFHMSGVCPWWSPPLPGISSFHETNVRTYVHHRGRDPGVWFFSLEAANRLAVCVGRWRWNLNYQRAKMRIERGQRRIEYSSRRIGPDHPGATTEVAAEILGPLDNPSTGPNQPGSLAEPGTLEHFLAERYLLYVRSKRGEILRGQVHHSPYPLFDARLLHCRETLLSAAGMQTSEPPCHTLFSPGVDVKVYPLQRVVAD